MAMLSSFVLAARPKTLLAGLAPALIGGSLAFSSPQFDLFLFFMTVVTALLLQIGANLTNDYCDFVKGADTATRKGMKRATQSGLISIQTMQKAIVCTFLLSALTGSYLIFKGGSLIALLLPIGILFAVLYTAGPFPLAYLGLGDLAVFFLFGPGAVCSTYYLQTKTFSLKAFILGIGVGLMSCAILMVNNIRDVEEDAAVDKKTLAVRFGVLFCKKIYTLEILGAALIPLYYFKENPLLILAPLILGPALMLMRTIFTFKDPAQLNSVLENTAKLTLIYALLLCFALLK